MSAVNNAAREAALAFSSHRSAARRAALLERIAVEIESLGDDLLQVCHRETALPLPRLSGERARTCGQLRMFAQLASEGSWVDARIDPALPDRKPAPRPDLRRMLIPLGPVAVFGASNFPLAFSVAGGDTASALAAGCAVVVKGHPAHPETSRMVAGAILRAVGGCGLFRGIFSLVEGGADEGLELVRHPGICAVAFTGSHTAGRALFDAAGNRPSPIPVFAEMGSVNPMVILPGAVAERGAAIAEGLAASVTLGVGQFCTKPGIVFLEDGPHSDSFLSKLDMQFASASGGTMLTPRIRQTFETERRQIAAAVARTRSPAPPVGEAEPDRTAKPSFAVITAKQFSSQPEFAHEVFGPFCLVVRGSGPELLACCGTMQGQLTGTIHRALGDELAVKAWLARLEPLAGRIIIDGFPTGVEVAPAMHHGGPYPATTDARFTSVGTAAIARFARPICYQNVPEPLLPEELRNDNPRALLRLVNGVPTREPVSGG